MFLYGLRLLDNLTGIILSWTAKYILVRRCIVGARSLFKKDLSTVLLVTLLRIRCAGELLVAVLRDLGILAQNLGVCHLDVDGLALALLAVDLWCHGLNDLGLWSLRRVNLAGSVGIFLGSGHGSPVSYCHSHFVGNSVVIIAWTLT